MITLLPEIILISVLPTRTEGALNITEIDIEGTLDGGTILPGFSLPLKALFENLPPLVAEEAPSPEK
jgi:hypothetical protein